MNTPTKEYGYTTAIAPEEIKALGRVIVVDETWIGGAWINVGRFYAGKTWIPSASPVRRPIDPGEGWEIVPGDENQTEEMEWTNGVTWFKNNCCPDRKRCDSYLNPDRCGILAFRRRKSEPAMGEGWELVPKELVSQKNGTCQQGWEFKNDSGIWEDCRKVNSSLTYRRPKSKPEQYGWLKPYCGVEMPKEGFFPAKMENGSSGHIYWVEYNGKYHWLSSKLPLACSVAYWFRMPPAPEVVKFDPAEKALEAFRDASDELDQRYDGHSFLMGWQAREEHYKKGAK